MFDQQTKRCIIICLIGLTYFSTGYLLTNRFPVFTPTYLTVLPFENYIPLIPWTSIIYLSDFLYLFIVVFLLQRSKIDRYFFSFIIMATIHFVVFLFFPTIYPRELWPLHINYLFDYPMMLTRWMDAPLNCFPSLHVGVCFLGSFFVLEGRKKWFPLFFVWAVLIALSTLTTKQHYFIDVVGGAILAIFSYWIVFRTRLLSKQ